MIKPKPQCRHCGSIDVSSYRISRWDRQCRACINAWQREYRQRRKREGRPIGGGGKSGTEYWRDYRLRTKQAHPERYKARNQIQIGLTNGSIKKPDSCSLCGIECPVHGHHEDYSKPLEVMWVCASCHGTIHSEAKGGE